MRPAPALRRREEWTSRGWVSRTRAATDSPGRTAKTLSPGAFAGLVVSGNTAATINFSSGLVINTASGPGVLASGGGTLNIIGPGNSITSGSGTAFQVTGEGNTVAVTCNAALTGDAGRLVDIQNHSTGDITLSGNLTNSGPGASG